MKKLFLVLMLSTLTFLGSTSFAQMNGFKDRPMFKKQRFMEQLNLTEEQSQKINDLRLTHQEKMIDVWSAMEKNRLEKRSMLQSGEFNQAKLMELTKANNDLKAEMSESRVKMWSDIHNMLDKNQKEIWTQHLADRGSRGFGHGKGMMGRHGMGFKGQGRHYNMHDGFGPGQGRGSFKCFRGYDRF